MCGLLGWYLPHDGLDPMARVMMADKLIRETSKLGRDSWGYLATTPTGPMVARGLGSMDRGVRPEAVAQFDLFLGHTRASTTGEITLKNAHPFRINDIIGAHNGIIYNHDELNTKYKGRHAAVDSKHIFHHLSEKRPLSELEGWGAVWYTKWSDQRRIYLFKTQSGRLTIYGLGTPDKCKGIIFNTCFMDARDGAELVSEGAEFIDEKVFEFQMDSDLLYYVEDRQLYHTSTEVKFGKGSGYVTTCGAADDRWKGWNQKNRKLLPIPRRDQLAGWSEVLETDQCDGCGFAFVSSVFESVDNLQLCQDCVRYKRTYGGLRLADTYTT